MPITSFKVTYKGRDYRGDVRSMLLDSVSDHLQNQISQRLEAIEGLEDEEILVEVDLHSSTVNIKHRDDEAIKQKIDAVFGKS